MKILQLKMWLWLRVTFSSTHLFCVYLCSELGLKRCLKRHFTPIAVKKLI